MKVQMTVLLAEHGQINLNSSVAFKVTQSKPKLYHKCVLKNSSCRITNSSNLKNFRDGMAYHCSYRGLMNIMIMVMMTVMQVMMIVLAVMMICYEPYLS